MDIRLTKLSAGDFPAIWQILSESFPPEERRTEEGQRRLLEETAAYQVYGYRKKDELQAILASWKFDEFIFIEHFAVRQSIRGGGLGGRMLQAFLAECDRPVLLEVELPEEEIKARRIHFYERNGFVLNEYDYMQPAMQPGCEAIPLLIMTHPKTFNESGLNQMRDTLYREVYLVN